MTAKHTPGPWLEMGDSSDEASGVIRIKTDQEWVNATEADVLVMLAATDLLTSLKLFADQIRFGGASHEERLAAVAAADAAIAKATGSA